MTALQFRRAEKPLVTVVVVTFGGWPLVKRTLSALEEHTPPCYELVILDNASPDSTAERLKAEVRGASLILEAENIGFSRGSNRGAEAGSGRLCCFLNPDAIVQPGWLPPLIETVDSDPTIAAAIPLLLNEDGTVQEAGSVVDSEGWAMAYGAGAPPEDLEYRFLRDVDFGSAACLLVDREAFFRVGAFDPAFGTGYYEDVDLCFKLRELGLRTVYQPRSNVVHVRFGSSTAESARARMQENRLVFLERWRDRLEQRPQLLNLAANPHRLVPARDAELLDRILVIDDRVPHVDRGSGDPRMAKLLLELRSIWPQMRVTLAASSSNSADEYAEPLLDAGVEVATPEDWDDWLCRRRFHYSVVLVSRTNNADAFRTLLQRTQPQALRIFDVEALSYRRLARLSELQAGSSEGLLARAQARRAREAEAQAAREAELVFSVSEDEASFVRRVAPETPVFVLPSFVETLEQPPGFKERRDLVFFGGFLAGPGSPNEDALLHLVSDVAPRIWEEEPELVLHVIGADPTPRILALDDPRVHVVGYVPDPNEWLTRARVHVHPMRFGAGIKLKLLETMAAGLPLVTTRVGAEGLGLGEVQPFAVTDDPAELARRTLLLYRDQPTWEAAQTTLLELVRNRFSKEAFRETLVEAMRHAGIDADHRDGSLVAR